MTNLEVQDLIQRTIDELNHLHYHESRPGSLDITRRQEIIQRIINDMQSLDGYGTAAEPSLSGEAQAFGYAMSNNPNKTNRIVFDVGAHRGEWHDAVRNHAGPGALVIYHFEPEPTSAAYLKSHGFTVQEMAVSDKNGMASVFTHEPGAAQASIDKPDFAHLGVEFQEIAMVPTTKISSFCKKHSIDVIDYLKLDVEGHEPLIIGSCLMDNMIEERRIRFIQFEFGINYVDQYVFFKDMWKMLSPYYKLYRIHPDGLIPVEKYQQELEVFHVVNYLCELKDE